MSRVVERLFLTVPRGCLQFVIVVFPDHTHLLFFISDVAVYHLHAHDIKFNVNPLAPNWVNFFLAETKKRKFLLITSN